MMRVPFFMVVGIFLAVGLAICPMARSADASLERTALPQGPLLNRLPDFAMYEIDFTYSSDGKQAPPKPSLSVVAVMPPRKVTVTKTKPILHTLVVDTLGRSLESWFDGTTAYIQSAGNSGPYAFSTDKIGSVSRFLNVGQNDFPDVDWVSPATYVGLQPMGNGSCLVFSDKTGGAKVWVDAASRFPVRWEKNGEVRTFKLLQAPTESLELPENIAKIRKELQVVRENNSRLPARGN
jgi:hypothetical protein